jgi:serine/threonine protein kinase
MSSAAPARLGKYTVTEILGKGAMGVVYKAFDPHIKRTVAIKTVRGELMEGGAHNLAARFRNEAQAAGRLTHPGIVGVYDYGEEGDLAYIVMEFVLGCGLDEYFKRETRFEAADVVSLMTQLLEALDHAHEQGIVHRDIKPSNIIVMPNGKLKVTDFGIAHIDTSDLTEAGMVLGTPSYIAPEQYLGLEVDRRADVFSAGVIFYQLLSGRKPFKGSPEIVSYKICHEDPQPPSSAAVDLRLAAFDAVALQSLAKKPEARYPTARAFAEAIRRAHSAPVEPALSDATIIHDTTRIPVRDRADASGSQAGSQPGSQPGSLSTGTTTGYPAHWDMETLRKVEDELARVVGPVARVMVKRAARQCDDLEVLYQRLAEDLNDAQDRTTFLSGQSRSLGSRTGGTTSLTGTGASGTRTTAIKAGPPVTDQQIEEAARLLAPYVGPIAKVLAKKAAGRSRDAQVFYQSLADQLADDREKAAFLKAAGAAG